MIRRARTNSDDTEALDDRLAAYEAHRVPEASAAIPAQLREAVDRRRARASARTDSPLELVEATEVTQVPHGRASGLDPVRAARNA